MVLLISEAERIPADVLTILLYPSGAAVADLSVQALDDRWLAGVHGPAQRDWRRHDAAASW
jgi:hypothetical protein